MAEKTSNLYPNETYTIELPLDDEHQEDVFVGINGKTWMVKRGEPVEVPGCVYEVLMESMQMDKLALSRQRKLMER